MGVGFCLTGRYDPEEGGGWATPGEWLERVVAWAEANAGEPLEGARVGEDGDGDPAAFLALHPCAEDVEVVVPVAGRVVASGKTSTVGPGYHTYVCGLLHRLGDDLGIAWDGPDEGGEAGDDAGYFHGGGRDRVEAEMLRWLRSVATIVRRQVDEDYSELMVAMSIGHRYPGRGTLVTPMGPRDLAWIEAVAADPSRGVDLFPWWSDGLTAEFFHGRALARMWKDVRWRTPVNDREGELLTDAHLDLGRAHALDPTRAYPWREWRELMDHAEAYFGYVEPAGDDLEPLVSHRALDVPDDVPLVGYRRGPVRVDLGGGWSIEVPGAMAESFDGDEGLWSAWDGRRTVWFNSFGLSKPDGSRPPAEEVLAGLTLPDGDPLEHRGRTVVGLATIAPHEEDGRTLWQLSGRSAVEGALAYCSVYFDDPADRAWAVATWRSIEHAG